MFYVGDILWLSTRKDIDLLPEDFSGAARWNGEEANFLGLFFKRQSVYLTPGLLLWFKNGKLHRDKDSLDGPGPALMTTDGLQEWYREGEWHREDGPAVTQHSTTGYATTYYWYYCGIYYGNGLDRPSNFP